MSVRYAIIEREDDSYQISDHIYTFHLHHGFLFFSIAWGLGSDSIRIIIRISLPAVYIRHMQMFITPPASRLQ